MSFRGYFIDSFGTNSIVAQEISQTYQYFSSSSKHIATGEGGMITTNNKELYEKLLLLRTHGIIKESKNFESKTHFTNNVFPNGIMSFKSAQLSTYDFKLHLVQVN